MGSPYYHKKWRDQKSLITVEIFHLIFLTTEESKEIVLFLIVVSVLLSGSCFEMY